MSRLPLRWRIVLASAASTTLILGMLSLFVYARLHAELVRATDIGLTARAQAIAAGLGQPGFSIADAPDAQMAGLTQTVALDGRVRQWTGSRTPLVPAATLRQVRDPRFIQLPARGRLPVLRGYILPVNEGRRLFVVVATSGSQIGQTLAGLRLLMAAGDPGALALACLAAWFLAGAALRPVERMRQEAAAISVSDPGRRLPPSGANDEISRLGTTLNSLLDRLQGALEFERRLLDNASHELRTPLGILKAELDLALSRARTPVELEAALRSASEETDRLACLAQDLLVLSRAASDDGIRIYRTGTSLGKLIEAACAGHRARAGQHGSRIECLAESADVMVDPMRLRQAMDNLLDNAIRHSDAGGPILVEAGVSDGVATIAVRNSGPGFPAGILRRAFEPFVRGPRDEGWQDGAGLGLAIVRAIAQAHGGTATAENLTGGARVMMTLAVSQEPGPDLARGTRERERDRAP